jgi:S-adenosylmethionine:tRNA ribosyltransferase-isomerase
MKILLTDETSPGVWNIIARGRFTGTLSFSESLKAHIIDSKTAYFENHTGLKRLIWTLGEMPLPPYLNREADESDKKRYQTVYAKIEGSIAAPTAGLHFTEALIDKIVSKGILVRTVTLHVGRGTFSPIRTIKLDDHTMEKEYFEIDAQLFSEMNRAKAAGNRIIVVGTTTTRALEGYISGRCTVSVMNGLMRGSTDIFIHEGYEIRISDTFITNFHLPRSTPLMLTAVFAGRENLINAYKKAITKQYRFFSYGDAMLVI